MKYNLLLSIFFVLNTVLLAQGPNVSNNIEFADLRLHLHESIRKKIQEEVDALHRSQKYFNIKLDRINQYFPIIERVLKEENVPGDFKYLVIQESALISDAVSTSNAVGFWQFKIPSAKEVGLRVDGNVDERLNITASTHGAAKYLKRNNFYFNNWLYALLSYNMGVGGASSVVNDKYFGTKKMDVNRKTHWYIIKFLAHKISFENYINKNDKQRLYEYTDGGGQNLKQIASILGVDYEELKNYNKWLKRGKVPEDKVYTVIIPGLSSAPVQTAALTPRIKIEDVTFLSPNSELYPKIKLSNEDTRIVKINGIPGVVANDREDLKTLALIGGLELSKFLKINEVDISHTVAGGNVYYFKSKKNKAREHYHTVMPEEELWMISQKYGIKKQKLMAKNRLKGQEEIDPGMVLWLRYIRAEDQPVEYVEIQTIVEQTNKNEGPPVIQDIEISSVEITDDNRVFEVNELSDEELAELDKNKEPLFHIVASGETLFAISRNYKIPIEEIYRINDLSSDDKLSIGQKIYLQEPFEKIDYSVTENENTSSDSYITYTVVRGDTMYSISKKHSVSIDDILSWNNKKNHSLKEGEILKIKKSK
jgi:membrane-bound lytic murein transglycosylase D